MTIVEKKKAAKEVAPNHHFECTHKEGVIVRNVEGQNIYIPLKEGMPSTIRGHFRSLPYREEYGCTRYVFVENKKQ